jgi:Ca2+-binding RTX toxin-like protein
MDDTILLGETSSGQLRVLYNGAALDQPWRNADGVPAIEQFQIDGLGGDDMLGFVLEDDLTALTDPQLQLFDPQTVDPSIRPVELSDLALRSSDWVGVINGGGGNDIIKGSAGRDRISGGPGSDTMYGAAGDDRLWGDELDGFTTDRDVLFGGTGHDDLVGGLGTNELYAWTSDPTLGGSNGFGIYVDSATGIRYDAPGSGRRWSLASACRRTKSGWNTPAAPTRSGTTGPAGPTT